MAAMLDIKTPQLLDGPTSKTCQPQPIQRSARGFSFSIPGTLLAQWLPSLRRTHARETLNRAHPELSYRGPASTLSLSLLVLLFLICE